MARNISDFLPLCPNLIALIIVAAPYQERVLAACCVLTPAAFSTRIHLRQCKIMAFLSPFVVHSHNNSRHFTHNRDLREPRSHAPIMASLRVAVVGAGTAGMATALLLQRNAYQVSLFERAPQPRVEGCGVVLRGNALDSLLEGGLSDVVDTLYDVAHTINGFSYRTMKGKFRKEEEPTPIGTERYSLLVRRADVLKAMWEPFQSGMLEGFGEFHGGKALSAVAEEGETVVATFEDGSEWRGDLLIGADGIRSQVAKYVAPERMFNYLGSRMWRGLATDDVLCTNATLIVFTRAAGLYANCFDLGRDKEGRNWTHWGLFREEEYETDPVVRRAFRGEGVPGEILSRLPKELATLVDRTATGNVVQGYEFDIDLLPRYVRGKVALIGDAAHCMASTLAWGMGSGIGDAVCIAKQLGSEHDLHVALRKYEEERLPVTQGYQTASRDLSVRLRQKKSSIKMASM